MPSCLALCLFLCLGSLCVATTICGHVCSTGPAKSRTHPLGVSAICSARCVVIAPLGAVTLVGGSSDPSVPRSPGVTFQEKAGRPMGPSTLRCEHLWEVVVVYVGLLFWFCSFLFVLCEAVVISQGSVFVFGPLSPSRPDPCLFFNCLFSSFFSLSGAFVDAVPLSLRRWGNPNLFGLGYLLCFFDLHALSDIDPYIFPYTYTKASPRTCFFFSYFRRRRSFAGLVFFLVSGLVGAGCLGGCFVPGLGPCWVAALHYRPRIL